jgi:DivIVA domain-containing protein
MANSHTSDTSPPRRYGRGAAASERLRDVSFPTAVRGYDRRAVEEFVEELREVVADLEARQTREGVVQKALDELGEETASILQRAHETADEIAARSRAQADGRLQRAEREAEIVKREADAYAEQVVADTRLLWDERQRLIEDIRHLADEVLATADDAMERLKLPVPLAAEEEAEPTTSEAPITPVTPISPVRVAPQPEDDPSVPYDLEEREDEEDPDAAVAWSMQAGDEDDPDATRPYPVEGPQDEYADEDEQDPDATVVWPAEGAADDPAGDPADPGTVELEALPGGNNADEQAAEREHKPD